MPNQVIGRPFPLAVSFHRRVVWLSQVAGSRFLLASLKSLLFFACFSQVARPSGSVVELPPPDSSPGIFTTISMPKAISRAQTIAQAPRFLAAAQSLPRQIVIAP